MEKRMLLVLLLAATAEAGEPAWTLDASGGVSVFLGSQSKALPHLIHPQARFGLMRRVAERLELGVELAATISGDDYRLLGGYVVAAAPIYAGEVFTFRVLGGFGAGTNPPILSADLRAKGSATLWAELGFSFRWALIRDRLALAIELRSEEVSVATIGAGIAFNL